MKALQELREKMKELALDELRSNRDNFKEIEKYLTQYIKEHKADDWLCRFRSAYLDERHQGFYEEAQRRQEERNKGKKNYKWLVGDDK